MKITFLGAAHEVTGSRHYLEACGKRFLIDYGMEQGRDIYPNAVLPCRPEEIDAVFLTHAHIDHSGWLPLLTRRGFTGPIYATAATADLCRIMLLDSAGIQESEAEWKNRKAKRRSADPVEPLYTAEDAERCCRQFVPCAYQKDVDICPGVRMRMTDVGHLLGSAAVTLTLAEDGRETVITFSGDIGNVDQRILRDPQTVPYSDYVVMESTYGDRSHGDHPDYRAALVDVLRSTFSRGGNVVIPVFAVGRAQEMLYLFREIKEEHLLPEHEDFKVYLDSPMAIDATGVFQQDSLDCFDEETRALISAGRNPLYFPGLTTTVTADESKAINFDTEPKVILASSGMCDAGRIRHHLKHNLWRRECTVLFVGYQSVGTLGRSLVDGAKEVDIFNETIRVNAQIAQLEGVSGHADNAGLMRWIGGVQGVKRVFVVHGEDTVADLFAARLRAELGLNAAAPYPGECWDLGQNAMLAPGDSRKIDREEPEAAAPTEEPPVEEPRDADSSVRDLEDAYAELGRRIKKLRARKERAKLTSALRKLLRKLR